MFQPVLAFLERFGNVVGRTILSIIYWVAITPVAVIYKLFADALLIKGPPNSTYREWSQVNDTLEDAHQQD